MIMRSWRPSIGRVIIHGAIASALALVGHAASAAASQAEVDRLPPAVSREIALSITELIGPDRVPSASVAILRDGEIAYARAFGQATLSPARPASASTIYAIGSNSKSFTAAAIMLLVEDGRMSLDDKLSKWFPELTSASDITVRQLLTHTSGYPDFYPHDYIIPEMRRDAVPDDVLRRWASKPLEFKPGTAWQYSNTGYMIAGRIVEKVSDEPYFDFLKRRILTPLSITSAINYDRQALGAAGATAYVQAPLGPLEPVGRMGDGWTIAAGDLAMTASDLARWDRCLMSDCLLSEASRAAMLTPAHLADGSSTQYGLGLGVRQRGGQRTFSHSGGVTGFSSLHIAYPDQRTAIIVLTNRDSGTLAARLMSRVSFAVLPRSAIVTRLNRQITAIRAGVPDRSEFTGNLDDYWSRPNIVRTSATLRRLGALRTIEPQGDAISRGGLTIQEFIAEFSGGTLNISTILAPDGKFEQMSFSR